MKTAKMSVSGLTGPLTTIAELAHLNLLTLLCCLPLITVGASLTAMHSVLVKMSRKEEGYIGRMFFDAFRDNFKKSTLLWLPFLIIFMSTAADHLIRTIDPTILPASMVMLATAAAIISFLILQLVFPLQACFENTVHGTLSNALLLSIAHFPKVLLMALAGCLPVWLALHSVLVLPLALVFCPAGPGFLAVKLYQPVFMSFETSDHAQSRPGHWHL